jgi:hypothetical protein
MVGVTATVRHRYWVLTLGAARARGRREPIPRRDWSRRRPSSFVVAARSTFFLPEGSMRGPKHYATIEEFEREEIRSHIKLGWSLDDLYADAMERRSDEVDESADELDF